MSYPHTLGAVLKRAALVTAANWPVALVQSTADGLFKFLIGAPLAGGVLLVTIVIGADIGATTTLDWRLVVATLVSSLLEHRIILVAFLLSLAVVIVGGSLFVFLVKGGTVGVLVEGERQAAGHPDGEVLTAAQAFTVERFIDAARRLFPRYARLGVLLTAVYALSGGGYLLAALAGRDGSDGWGSATLLLALLVAWTTVVNLFYLLVQIVIAVEDCGISAAARRAVLFLRHEWRLVSGVFGVVLAMVVFATGASLLAFTALGVIFLVPVAWLAAVPLQLAALLIRAVVFQYIALSSVAAYLTLYRAFAERTALATAQPAPLRPDPITNPS